MRHGSCYATIMTVLVTLTGARAQEKNATDGLKVMDRFLGVWNVEITDKTANGSPGKEKPSSKESATWILKNRYLLGRAVGQPDRGKSLWLMTYDAKTNSYPFWMFNNKGLLGLEWRSTWDDSTSTFIGKATNMPKGWTKGGIHRFPDKDSNQAVLWTQDDTGTLVFDGEVRKTRQPDASNERVLAAWSKTEKADAPPLPELKVLERFIGTWDTVAVSKQAVRTPTEMRMTSKVTRKWVLDGRFVQDTSEVADGQEGFSLITFDPQMKKYRNWWFSSEGHNSTSTGAWDATTETMSFKADLADGLTQEAFVRFIDKDHHDWTVTVKDGHGKLYFDSTWTMIRRSPNGQRTGRGDGAGKPS